MEKTKADALITDYLGKIYGFAYKKSFSYGEAEELAAEMTSEVYRALRGSGEVVNPEGYVWRICEHTYARYVSSVKKQKGISIDETADIPYYDTVADDDGEIDRLRREIAFLSSQRREIVFRFYYKNEPIRSIASRLAVPVGTVKWHLNKARNELKEGLEMERERGWLGINPVVACDFGHSGGVGYKGGPEYYLGDRLSLNIVYSVYFEPRNTAQIAEELGVTPVFIVSRENEGRQIHHLRQIFAAHVFKRAGRLRYEKETRGGEDSDKRIRAEGQGRRVRDRVLHPRREQTAPRVCGGPVRDHA